MKDPIIVGNVLGEARNSDEMLEIWRAHKARIGLSNKDFDELANFGDGHVDKLLGPTGAKNFGPVAFTAMNWTLAIKWVAVVDIEHAKVMEQHWEDRQREIGHVRPEPNRISKKLVARAKPIVFKETGRLGGLVTAHLRTPAQRSEAARKAARAKHRKHRKLKRQNPVRCEEKSARP